MIGHPVPLKLRPYGAIQICLLLLLLLLAVISVIAGFSAYYLWI